jgi:hypothetical protein
MFVGINWLAYCDVPWSSSRKYVIGNYWGLIGVVHTLVAKGTERQCSFNRLKMSVNMYPNMNAADLDTTPVRKDIITRGRIQDTVCCIPESTASIIIYCTVLHVPACRPSSSRDSTECNQTILKATAYPANGKRSNSMQISNTESPYWGYSMIQPYVRWRCDCCFGVHHTRTVYIWCMVLTYRCYCRQGLNICLLCPTVRLRVADRPERVAVFEWMKSTVFM